MASVMASAEPSNSEVLAAVNNGNFTEAESMLDTVVQNHPRSAKAHYLLSEVYAKENKVPMAKQELAVALGIDPSGKFASAGKLAAYQTALNSTATTATTTTTTHQHLMVQPSQQYSPPIQHSHAGVISFLVVLFIMALVLVAILGLLFIRDGRRELPPRSIYVNGGTPIYPSGGSPSIVTPSASSYPPTMYPPVHQYSSGGMGVGSVALGAAGGLVAGMALESALSNGHYHGGGYRNGFDLYDSYEDTTTTTTTTTSESTPSFSFDSGSDQSSGWDSGGSSSSDSGSSWD